MLNKKFYRAFEDKYRGSRELIKDRISIYIPFILPLKNLYVDSPALDIGCGRGEWLELLKDNDILAHGIDFDEGMLTACNQLGLDVLQGDGIKYLKEQDSESKIVISAFHVVEHISFEDLQLFVEESLRVLKPGGLLIMETPNPENIRVATEYFYLDPTHIKPIPSSLLSFLPEFYGFARTKVIRLQESQDLLKQETANILQVIEGISPDYAVIAQKDASLEILSQFDDTFLKEYGLSLNSITNKFENRLLNIEAKASEAEAKASEAEAKASEAEAKASEAEAKASEAEAKASEAEAKASEAEAKASEAEAKASEAEARATQAEQNANEANARATQAEQHIELLLNSNSWKITKPLRLLSGFVGYFLRGVYSWISFAPGSRPRRVMKNIFFESKYIINKNPKLKNLLMAILNLFPTLKGKLKNISPTSEIQQQHERDELTFQAQNIYDDLKYIFESIDNSMDSIHVKHESKNLTSKLKMAIVTPFPPDRTGIADYVAELLPKLTELYDIEIITEKRNEHHCDMYTIQTIEYFKTNTDRYNRIIYQVGNSPYHGYMFELIRKFPGVVILHDFYLGNLVHWMQGNYPNAGYIWDSILLDSYGYTVPYQKYQKGTKWAVFEFPANAQIFKDALGIIVHSRYAKDLASQWYGNKFHNKIHLLPQVHNSIHVTNPQKNEDTTKEFVVCSFGHLTQTKLIHKIISAWSKSIAGKNSNNRLCFVGALENGDYGQKIQKLVESIDNVQITGFVDDNEYKRLLSNTDLAIQLRSESRGETSRAVLDCMAYGIPTIINANGSMAEFPNDAVFKLQNEFNDDELISALNELYENHNLAQKLSIAAKETISQFHNPKKVVKQLENIIENVYTSPSYKTLSEFCIDYLTRNELPNAEVLSQLAKQFDFESRNGQTPTIYVDISAVAINDLKTGIQRVVRSILIALLEMPFVQYKIIPVYLTDRGGYWHYRVAHTFMKSFIPDLIDRSDTVIEPSLVDIFFGLDYYADAVTQAVKFNLFSEWKARGVIINFVVYDILPIEFPHFFPSTSYEEHLQWLISISQVSDNLLCISNTVAEAVNKFLKESVIDQNNLPHTTFFHLGADIDNSIPSKGMPENTEYVLSQLSSSPSFVSVGTIEPRKGQMQTLLAFEKIWADGIDIKLVIIGKQGWMVDEVVAKIRNHPKLNKQLFWLEGISDEYLEKVYTVSTCLIAASEGEGFGLPLIEAAQHKLPIIARDIPVFREVAGEYAYYFENDNDSAVVEKAIVKWLEMYKNNEHPKSDEMPWLTWEESARQILKLLQGERI